MGAVRILRLEARLSALTGRQSAPMRIFQYTSNEKAHAEWGKVGTQVQNEARLLKIRIGDISVTSGVGADGEGSRSAFTE